MAVASPGTASAFQLRRRGSKKRERKKKGVCQSVSCYQADNNFLEALLPLLYLVDTSLATVGDLVISSNLGFWQESILTLLFKPELEVR